MGGVRQGDFRGRDAVMAWQTDHRINNPYPLRHNGTNVHIVEESAGEASFASYIYVTQMVQGAPGHLSSGIVNGAVREVEGTLKISELHVILDTMESDVYSKVRS